MRLSNVPNFRLDDFPDQKDWIGKLFGSLNPLVQSLNQLLNSNVDFNDNIKAVTQSYTINGFQSIGIKWPFTGPGPGDLRVIQASKTNQRTPIILVPAWGYDSGSQIITITRIAEINASSVADLASNLSDTYYFTVRASI